MRISRYLLYITILTGIFLKIYQQSDKKGFDRLSTSFKTAVIIAAIVVGLFSKSPKTIESSVPTTQVNCQKLSSEQELRSFETNYRKVIFAGHETSGNPSNVPSNTGRSGQSPSNFPTTPSGSRHATNRHATNRHATSKNVPSGNSNRLPPKTVDQGLKKKSSSSAAGKKSSSSAPGKKSSSSAAGKKSSSSAPGNGAGSPGSNGGGASFESDQCITPKKEAKNFEYDFNSKKKKECKIDELTELPEFGTILEGSIVPVESLIGTSSGFKGYYEEIKKNPYAHRKTLELVQRLAEGSLQVKDINVKKMKGFKRIYEAKNGAIRLYFRKEGDLIQILLPSFKLSQDQCLELIKRHFK